MKYRSCLTCEYFKENRVTHNKNKDTYETKVLDYESDICYHELSEGRDSYDMIHNGPCGVEMSLWIRKGSKNESL